MKAHIWYGPNGQILAVGSIQGDFKLTPVSTTEDVKIIDADLSEEQLQKLHETHKVDVTARTLVAA